MNENPSAYYVHCFAYQLQLVLVAVTENHCKMDMKFTVVANVCNVVEASAKSQDIFWEAQADEIFKGFESGELKTERGLNQKMGLSVLLIRVGSLIIIQWWTWFFCSPPWL